MCHGAWEISIFPGCLTAELVHSTAVRAPAGVRDVENNPGETLGLAALSILHNPVTADAGQQRCLPQQCP